MGLERIIKGVGVGLVSAMVTYSIMIKYQMSKNQYTVAEARTAIRQNLTTHTFGYGMLPHLTGAIAGGIYAGLQGRRKK